LLIIASQCKIAMVYARRPRILCGAARLELRRWSARQKDPSPTDGARNASEGVICRDAVFKDTEDLLPKGPPPAS